MRHFLYFVDCPELEFDNLLDVKVQDNTTDGTVSVFAPQECPMAPIVLKCDQQQDGQNGSWVSVTDRCPDRTMGKNIIP